MDAPIARELITALKALAEPTRLRLVGRLGDRPHTTDELVAATGLPRRVVDRQVGLLRANGVVTSTDGRHALRIDTLHRLGRALDELEGTAAEAGTRVGPTVDPHGAPDGASLSAEEAKVLRSFLVDGRLESIPAQERKRLVVLRYLRDACFGENRAYPEKEVNQRLALYHRDVASLRRYLIDYGLMTRERGEYRRADGG